MSKNISVWDFIVVNWGKELSKLSPSHLKQLIKLAVEYQILNTPIKTKNNQLAEIMFKIVTIIDNNKLAKMKIVKRNKTNISKRWNTKGNTTSNTISNTTGNTNCMVDIKEKEKVVQKEKENILEYNNIYNNNIYKYNNNIYNIKEKEIYKEKEKVERDFNVKFFDKYPKQVNRLVTLQTWFDIFKDLVYNDENYNLLLTNISDGLDNWIKYETCWKDQNGKFVMNPNKWLLNKNWERKFSVVGEVGNVTTNLTLEQKKEQMRKLGYKVD